ncbi:unnamed protein product [Sympodiomycopsis kandeliae]
MGDVKNDADKETWSDVCAILEEFNQVLSKEAGHSVIPFAIVECQCGLIARGITLTHKQRQFLGFLSTEVRGQSKLRKMIFGEARLKHGTGILLPQFNSTVVASAKRHVHLLVTNQGSRSLHSPRNAVIRATTSNVMQSLVTNASSLSLFELDLTAAKVARSFTSDKTKPDNLAPVVGKAYERARIGTVDGIIIIRGLDALWLILTHIQESTPAEVLTWLRACDQREDPIQSVRKESGTIDNMIRAVALDYKKIISAGPWFIFAADKTIYVPCPELGKLDTDNLLLKEHQRAAVKIAALLAGTSEVTLDGTAVAETMQTTFRARYLERKAARAAFPRIESIRAPVWHRCKSQANKIEFMLDTGSVILSFLNTTPSVTHPIVIIMRRYSRQTLLPLLVTALSVCQLLASSVLAGFPQASDYNVHSISVNHELGGSLHSTSQLHLVQQPEETPLDSKYYIGLSAVEAASLSSSEVNLKFGPGILPNQRAVAALTPEGSVESFSDGIVDLTHLYSVELPHSFFTKSDAADNIVTPNITIAVDLTFHKLSEALPKAVPQKAAASLLWEGDATPRSPYGVGKVRVKARSPHPQILSHRFVPSSKGDSELITKSGSTITFGPQSNIPPVLESSPRKARVHYTFDQPIASIVTLDRHVEVSHWGDNLAFEDRLWLRNDGPELKGHFSRVDHQIGAFYGGVGKNLVADFGMQLPAGAKDAYFVDQIGNVSTSHFRSAPSSHKDSEKPSHLLPESLSSILHIQPRYPIMGGWNYTFTIGWNLPFGPGGWGKALGSNEYSVAVPFWNVIRDIPVGEISTRIILPEGAQLISLEVPFEASEDVENTNAATIEKSVYTTYLDTIGRQSILIKKQRCGTKEGANVYIKYKFTTTQLMLKPFSIAFVGFVLFATALVFRKNVSN